MSQLRIKWTKGSRGRGAIRGAMDWVHKELVDVERVREELSVSNPAFHQAKAIGVSTGSAEPIIELFEETDEMIGVPRHYKLPWHRDRKPDFVRKGEAPWGSAVKVAHHITIRDTTQREAGETLGKPGDKIISLACGKGKTVVSLWASATYDRSPTLIVVHTTALLTQWRERIMGFYDLEETDIGHVQADVCRWRGKPIAIAMLHSLVLKQYPSDFYTYWRTIIFDEVHKLGAGLFQKAARMFPGERWGLSATVDRPDGMDRVFRMHLGKVAYEDLEQELKPTVYFVRTGLRASPAEMAQMTMRFNGRINLGRLYSFLADSRIRNALIKAYINKAAREGRTILVLSERVQQIHEMAEHFKMVGVDASVHVGSMKPAQRTEALKHQLVFSTQQLATEGLDRPAFDTLFILIPFGGHGRLQQSAGRILRTHAGKRAPKIVIFEDDISIMRALARKMRKACDAMGFEIKEATLKEGVEDFDGNNVLGS